jgi:hypothetical protein
LVNIIHADFSFRIGDFRKWKITAVKKS